MSLQKREKNTFYSHCDLVLWQLPEALVSRLRATYPKRISTQDGHILWAHTDLPDFS